MAKTQAWTSSTFVTLLHEHLAKTGTPKFKKSDLRKAVDDVFEQAVWAGAHGQRVRFPGIGSLAWREVKARRAGTGTNPFTHEPMIVKARPASRKPRWSFPKSVREAYARQMRRAA